jgi:6-pyruvoyltetrahydropterin/6-carboxytetrahydropterin synthase
MFKVSVTRRFKAAHALSMLDGRAEELHHHVWRLKVDIAGECLDDAGMLVDFAVVDRALDEVVSPIEGSDIGSCPSFKGISPSAENIAQHIFYALTERLSCDSRRIEAVSVWEDEDHCATFLVPR